MNTLNESCRLAYDAHRVELANAESTAAAQVGYDTPKVRQAQAAVAEHKAKYERLRGDVQVCRSVLATMTFIGTMCR